MSREQLALKVWNSPKSLAETAARYGLTRKEARELADLGCKLQAREKPPRPERQEPTMPFKEALPIILEMAEAGASWREIAEATGRQTGTVQQIAARRGIVKTDGRRGTA